MKKVKEKTALEAEIENLPDVTRGRIRSWTAEQDRLILKYCQTKGIPAVAAILGVDPSTVRRRFRMLEAKPASK